MGLRYKSKLESGIIPTSDYPSRKWYYHGDKLWYYHGRRARVPVPERPDVSATLDDLVKPLARFLHVRRIPTTPSCSGHFHKKSYFRKIWNKLTAEAEAIVDNGIYVRDVETNTAYVFKDKKYELPWESFKDFLEEVKDSQTEGYLGFYVRDPSLKERLKKLISEPSETSPFFSMNDDFKEDVVLFYLTVPSNNGRQLQQGWKSWTKKIKNAFIGVYGDSISEHSE